MKVPDGWEVEPRSREFTVPASSTTKMSFTLIVPASTRFFDDLEFIVYTHTNDREFLSSHATQTELRPKFDLFIGCAKEGEPYHVKVKALNRDAKAGSGTLRLLVPQGKCSPANIETGPIEPLSKKVFRFQVTLLNGRKIDQSFPLWAFLNDKRGSIIGLATTGIAGEWRFKTIKKLGR